MKKTKIRMWLLAGMTAFLTCSCSEQTKYQYETVENDPMHSQLYTLENGLKIYMTVNKEQPRIQTYIAVHAGGKDDPAESTGLAHYLEHLMFKGTKQFGTWNYEKEAVELSRIDSLYEIYTKTTDKEERKNIYHQIDSVSYEASRYAIPNEYDKLMAAIGSDGSNAFTSNDVTCYTEDIPSNQLENWAKIESDRFQNMVIRLFHTELESVYEEKNMSLVRDSEKAHEAVCATLFPNHPYGTQTVIGTQEHLKNPSLVNIRNYYNNYYRPNNVAICLSGDFNPDEVVDIIQKYFGSWEPNKDIKRKEVKPQPQLKEPVIKEVLGKEAENVMMAWRTPGEKEEDRLALDMVSTILQNDVAGMMDLDLIQTHKLMAAAAFHNTMEQGSEFTVIGYPMPEQSLEEVRQLLLTEIEKLRKGDFDDRLLTSVKTDYKLSVEKALEDNDSRAMQFVNSFIAGQSWAEKVAESQKTQKLSKEDIMRVANKYLGSNNYVCVNKRQGVDPNIVQIEKPEINPVMTNRDSTSHFLREIQESKPAPIAPVFLDYKKELSFGQTEQGAEVIYKENTLNSIFQLTFIYEIGSSANRKLKTALEYFDLLGTDKMSADEVKKSFYNLGCKLSAHVTNYRTFITLSGLDENKTEALRLMEDVIANMKVDEDALQSMKIATLQEREVMLTRQNFCYNLTRLYTKYGMDYIKMQTLSNNEIESLQANELIDMVKGLKDYQYRVTYYGPSGMEDVIALVNTEHKTSDKLLPTPEQKKYTPLPTNEDKVFFCHYNAPNACIQGFSNLEKTFDATLEPSVTLFNEYFGGGMNSIVFQEIRESRGLAYSCSSYFASPDYTFDPYTTFYSVTTQADKLNDCMKAFNEIIENMPQSKSAFQIAREALLTRLRTQRTTRDAIITSYLNAQDYDIDYDLNQTIFNEVEKLTLDDMLALQQKYFKAHTHSYSIVADQNKVDWNVINALGTVQKVDIKDICGY